MSLLTREKRIQSVFSPPPLVKSALGPKVNKAIHVSAETERSTVPLVEKKPSLPQPLLPPTGLGSTPKSAPVTGPPPPLLTDLDCGSPTASMGTPFSPLSTPISAFSHTFTDQATAARVYPIDMFRSVRHDASHTPHGVLRWCLFQYSENPILKTPTHLQLSMNEIISAKDGAVRGTLGSAVKGKHRQLKVKKIQHKVLSVLSRLTEEKYTALLEELKQLPLRQCDETELQEVVDVFFEKSVTEAKFSHLYARLVAEICTMSDKDRDLDPNLQERLLSSRLQKMLINTCETQFAKPIELTEDDMVDRTTGAPFDEEEIEHKRTRLKNSLVGNVKFVGELYKFKLVNNRIVERILHLLVDGYDVNSPTDREEYVFECFQTLIKTIGAELHQRIPHVLAHYLAVARQIQHTHPKQRVKFFMMNIADLNKQERWIKEDMINASSSHLSLDLSSSDLSPTGLGHSGARFSQNDLSSDAVNSSASYNRGPARPIDSQGDYAPPARGAANPSSPNIAIPKPRNSTGSASPNSNSSPHAAPRRAAEERNSSSKPEYGKPKGAATPATSPIPPKSQPAAKAASKADAAVPRGKGPNPTPMKTPTSAAQRAPPFSPSQLTPTNRVGYASPPSGSSLHSLAASEGIPTPLRSQPNISGDMVDMQLVAEQLMELYHHGMTREGGGEVENVMRCITEMSLRNKVLCITWWLRKVCTSASLFEEREEIPYLFDDVLRHCLDIKRDLQEAVIEWVRFDTENAEYERCPRFFDHVAQMLAQCQSTPQLHTGSSDKAARPANSKMRTPVWELTYIRDVRDIFPVGLFNVMLYTLTKSGGTDQILTLVKSAQPTYHNMYFESEERRQSAKAEEVMLQELRSSAFNRIRLLPYCLSVSTIQTNGDYYVHTPTSTPKHRSTTNSPLIRSSPLGDSVTSIAHYDPLAQALVFPKVADDIELDVFRRVRSVAQEKLQGKHDPHTDWISAIVHLATDGGDAPYPRVIRAMKVTGALLTCSTINLQRHTDTDSEESQPMITNDDLDEILSRMQAKFEEQPFSEEWWRPP
ncbi:hypothetical protein AGDE_08684 [Angomonas deanei]|uniref:MIF4G domain/CRM1 C terminal, putative n=1 Tax=Angomonas deanei TaxID=59799 RepID=A0A7G2CPP8_9TRYP|nr:hypothetical protein AGDE_08684 [Angomonas deanei]CAD2221826.1 MIF4G domain/CRM1 C terminal, putative [Angomonas deanei]|eukprot:EPY32449.1 hypothetical protein AGDE_08684 [Angomonas deanei]